MDDNNRTHYTAKPLGRFFKWLRILFFAYIVSEVILSVGNYMSLTSGSVMFGPDEPFKMGDWLSSLGGLGLFLSFFASVIVFGIFSVRAAKNLRHWNAKPMEMAPGWTVGWYFIPIANLWKPFGAMNQIWDGTDELSDKPFDVPKFMGLWWLFWIVTNIASNASWRMGMRAGYMNDYATDVDLYKTTLWIDIFSAVTGIAAALLLLPILKKIAQKQDQYIHEVTFE